MSYNLFEVQSIDKEVQDSLKELEENLSKLENGGGIDVDYNQVKKKIEWTNGRIRALGYELNQLNDREVSRKFKKSIKEYESKIKDYEKQLKWSTAGRQQSQTEDLRDKYGDITKDGDKAVEYGEELLDRIDNKADEALNIVHETYGVAIETAEQVHDQTEQLGRIDDKLKQTDQELDRATRIIRRMARRVMTDRYIWALIFLIFCAIIGVIVAAVLKGEVKKSDSEP